MLGFFVFVFKKFSSFNREIFLSLFCRRRDTYDYFGGNHSLVSSDSLHVGTNTNQFRPRLLTHLARL